MSLKQSLLDLQLSQAQSNAGLFLLEGYLGIQAAESEYDKKFGIVRDKTGQFAKKAGEELEKQVTTGIPRRRSEREEEAGFDKAEKDARTATATKDIGVEAKALGRNLKRSIAELSDSAIEKAHAYTLSDDFKEKAKKVMEAVDKIDKAAGDAFKKVHDAYVKHVSEENRKKISDEVKDGFPATKGFIDRKREALSQAADKANEVANTMAKSAANNLPAVVGAFCATMLLTGNVPLAAAAGISSIMVAEELKEAARKAQQQKAMNRAKAIINKNVQNPTQRQQMIYALESAQRQAEFARQRAK